MDTARAAEVDLDDVGVYERMDPAGMAGAVEGFPEQCRQAARAVREMVDLPDAEGIGEIVVLGMGGSAIGGDFLKELLQNALGMPVTVHRGYCPPSYHTSRTLVFAVSYSGNTEETLTALDHLVYLGCRVVAITSGGVLLQKAEGFRWPVIRVPGGMQPRAALPWLSLPMALLLERMGVLQGFSRVLEEAISKLRERAAKWGRLQPTGSNFAKQLALRLHGKIPVIYGMEGPMSVAAYRWKCQINENSKQPAFCHVLPEMNHNEIVGWELSGELARRAEVVFLLDEEESPRTVQRMKITSELIKDDVGGVSFIHVSGASRTEKLLSSILLGDFVSVYLALLNGQDPTPVERISRLKQLMAEAGGDATCRSD